MSDHSIRAPSFTARVEAESRRLGFSLMGVADAGFLPWKQHFETWLQCGMYGEMEYLARRAGPRIDPSLVLNDIRSILILAMNYYVDSAGPGDRLRGKISRYAQGEDYHRVMLDRLQGLLSFITRERPGAHGICYADTGPVMEKVWGAHSGLGWMGKHSNLIAKGMGSWFFIGVILLDIKLTGESRHRDHCGTCLRCIEACPTGAIVAPYVVDARLCVSYLTIELRGAIPRHLRRLIGNRIFGCDDCQEACPWNRFAATTAEPSFRPRAGNVIPKLASLVDITSAEFLDRYRNSPIRRAKRDGLVRNVVVALGNSNDPEAVPALAGALRDPSALVRAHAAWALGQIHTLTAESALERAAGDEPDSLVREEIGLALSGFRRQSEPGWPGEDRIRPA